MKRPTAMNRPAARPSPPAVLGALTVGLLLVGCGSTAPTPASSAVSPPGATGSPSAPAATPDPAGGWHLADLADAEPTASFHDVLAMPEGFLAVGSGGPNGMSPIVVRSTDGLTWVNEAIASATSTPSGLVAIGDRVVAVGGGESNRCAHPSELDTWARDATGAWTEAPFDRVFCFGGGNATLVSFDGRALIVGAGSGDVPYLLTSNDGLRWSDVGEALGDLYPRAAAASGTDLWVFASDAAGRSVVLRRAAGAPFGPPAAIVGLGPDANVLGALWLGSRLVVVATAGANVGILTPDGAGGWSAVQADGLPADQIARVVAVDGRLVALGGDGAGMPRLWSSADGSSWMAIDLPAGAGTGATLSGLAVRDGIAVLVGQITTPDGSTAIGAIWTAPSTILAP